MRCMQRWGVLTATVLVTSLCLTAGMLEQLLGPVPSAGCCCGAQGDFKELRAPPVPGRGGVQCCSFTANHKPEQCR